MTKSRSLGDALFTKTQQQVLRLLFGQPGRSFYANEIVRYAGLGIGTVQRELARLSEVGLLIVTRQGNQKHYQANGESPIFEELRGIVVKTFGVADLLKEALQPEVEKIQLAFIFGSVAKGSDTAASDIDLMIIADGLSYTALMACLGEVEMRLGRAVNPILYSSDELQRKRKEDNAFVQRVLQQPKIILMGSMDDAGES
ncbi:MAG: nucleotidyltransferase domain-containing protein [Pseudomonadota bacterium]|nr:nucleotidyltransferase domain-containing protein [Pseudomonadota bacterium]